MPGSAETRLLAYVRERGGDVETAANLDPQWNEVTAETTHYQDLRHELAADADLDGDARAVIDVVEALVDRELLARTVTPERAHLELTEAGAEALEACD